jgi:hypothetical protein
MREQIESALLCVEGVETIDRFSVSPLRETFIVTCELSIVDNRLSLDIARDCLMALYELLPRNQWMSPAFTLKTDTTRWNYAYNINRNRWQIINLLTSETSYTEDTL